MGIDHLLRRRLGRRDLLKAAGGLGLSVPAAALLTACGGSGGGSSGPEPSASSPSEEDEAEETSPKRGGTLRVALTGDPPNLDTHQTTDAIVVLVTSHMFETLFTWDDEYSPVPLLADSHEVSEDGLLITLRLREGVPFHNGEEMQAADVIASINRWGRVVGLGGSFLEVTDEIVEVDPYTIEFHLSQPFGTFTVALARALQGCTIYPKSVLDQSTDTDLAEYVGTGPYQFIEWQPDRFVRMERFADYASPPGESSGYAGHKEQYFDELRFIPVRNEASRIAGLQAGDYHYLETVSSDHYSSLMEDSSVAVDLLEPDSWLNLVLNLRSPVMENHDIRRAFQLALDHGPTMRAAFGEDFYELSPTLVPGADIWYTDAGSEYYNQHNPEEARRLLEDSSYDGTPLRMMTTQEIQQEYNGTVVIKQQLEDVGFSVDLQVYDGATLSDRRNDPELWETYTAWASFRPDPVMRNLTCSATGWWCEEEKDEILAQFQSESEFEIRYDLWEQVQQQFFDDVPRIKVGDSRRVLVRSPKLQNVGPTELQPEFSNAWLKE